MQVGDAVRFIGFCKESTTEWPSHIGIVIEIHNDGTQRRYTVAWPDGTTGRWLYADTLEVVSESR